MKHFCLYRFSTLQQLECLHGYIYQIDRKTRTTVTKMEKLLPKSETDGNVELLTFQPIISTFISSIINNKKLNTYEGLSEEIFFRELIFNCNNTLHHMYRSFLRSPSLYRNIDKILYIKIILNKMDRTLTIIDNGFGMTKNDLINKLGYIEKIDKNDLQDSLDAHDISTIIGFHSAYLVANKIIVITKQLYGEQSLWESSTDESYTIRCNNDEPLTHGTRVVLHIREDQSEYLEESKIKEMIEKYYRFIEYPIKLIVQKECKEEVSENKIEDKENESPNKQSKSKNKEKRKKQIVLKKSEEVKEFIPPGLFFMKNPKDIREDEYVEFYKWLNKDCKEYLAVRHFFSHGQLNYTTLLFIPRYESNEISKKYNRIARLYVKRVLVKKVCDKLLPKYLNFIKVIVNSEDLSIGFNDDDRKTVKLLHKMYCDLLPKIFEFFHDLAKDKIIYKKFYEQFSENIKCGIITDFNNCRTLMQFLRYYTTASGDEMCSLNDYISRMKDNQQYIYFIHCNNIIRESIKNNVFVKYVRKRGFEVIYMFDARDGYITLWEFLGNKFMSITNKDLKFSIEDSEKKKREENKIKKFENLRITIKSILPEMEDVVIFNRFMNWPCCIVTSQIGWNLNFVNSLGRSQSTEFVQHNFNLKKYFEINPDHIIIVKLMENIKNRPCHQCIYDIIMILFETALLSYKNLENPQLYATRIYSMIELLFNKDCFFSKEQNCTRKCNQVIVPLQYSELHVNDETMEQIL